MIDEGKLIELLRDLESDRVERTESTRDTDKFCEAVCAFSNDFPFHREPGYLIIGVDNQGVPTGLKVSDELLRNLGGIRSDGNVQPLPAISVNKMVLPRGEVAVVEVLPSDLPPVRYKGRVWIRVGPRRAMASETEERILSERRASLLKTFDARPCLESRLNDLVLDLFLLTYRANAFAPEVIEANNRDSKEQMAALRFYDLARDCPTFAGVLLFGKDPRYWMPGAYVQFLRIDGEDLAENVINDQTFSGDLLTLLRDLDRFLPQQLQSRPRPVSALREEYEHDYPLPAVRELLLNAVMHRSYEATAPVRFYWFKNHIEIQNPGGLYGEARPENFPYQNTYRNPVIAEAMRILGFINKYGSGVMRARQQLADNGNPPPEFKNDDPNYFLVTIRGKR